MAEEKDYFAATARAQRGITCDVIREPVVKNETRYTRGFVHFESETLGARNDEKTIFRNEHCLIFRLFRDDARSFIYTQLYACAA